MQARSFIVRIPTSVLPVSGSWQVRLAAGLANPAGTEFATVPAQDGGIPGGTNVYNVTFRTYQQEAPLVCPTEALADSLDRAAAGRRTRRRRRAKPATSRWSSAATSGWRTTRRTRLRRGNVSKYALAVNWSQLAARRTDARTAADRLLQPLVCDAAELGQGVREAEEVEHLHGPDIPRPRAALRGLRPDLLQPVHAHAADVDPALARRQLNQYGALAPSQLQEECQDRDSICATTEGFSDGQWYFEAAQVDFWDVWHQLADDYDLDPDATVISGYSMGGFASYKLALEYPDLFAQSMPLEGPVVCGERIVEGVETAAGSGGQCEKRRQHDAADRQRASGFPT